MLPAVFVVNIMSLPVIHQRQSLVESEFSADVHPLLKSLLLKRGISSNQQIQHELSQLADPFLMKGMQLAVERLWAALQLQQKIIIVGDFDADGATSSALAILGLKELGFANVNFVVPNRFEYGYGLSEAIVEELAWQKPELIITVDNGISSIAGVDKANALGVDVIVTDHHLPGQQMPAALAIINPNQNGCLFPGKALAGVGVFFHLLIALRKFLREQEWFARQGRAEPNLANYLDIVALGTVADVVPMDFYNRILVAQGIKRIRAGMMRPGIRQLLQVAEKDYRYLSSVDLGFALAPRLNAAGRLDDMTQGIMLLTTASEDLAFELAKTLDDFNRDRRIIEQQMQIEAMQIVDSIMQDIEEIPRGFCLYHPDWHQGVVGLVASRIKEKFHRPVIAFANADNGELKGSGRSIKGIHLRDLLDDIATSNPSLLDKFGGHAMAAGLSLAASSFDDFQKAYIAALGRIEDTALFEAMIESDGAVEAKDMNLFTAQLLRDSMPWGQQFPEPVFDGTFYVKSRRALGEKHLKLQLSYESDNKALIEAILFNTDANQWMEQPLKKVFVVYKLAVNHYRSEQSLQLMIQTMQAVED
jgi:single-stranded-DNA-specific exonuclease